MARSSVLLIGCLLFDTAWADEPALPVALPQSSIPLQWSLSDQEMDSVLRRSGAYLEEVAVQSTLVQLKMRDPTQEIWTGPAAVFWALFHPTQSWRIFLPVPPAASPASAAD